MIDMRHLTTFFRLIAIGLLCSMVFVTADAPSHAEGGGNCAGVGAKVQAATGAVQKSASDHAITFEMTLPRATAQGHELQIVCPAFAKTPSGYSIVATWSEGSNPADGFFQQIGAAGAALTGEAAAKIQKAARACQADAAQSQTSTAEIEAGKAFLNCQSFARLGGATTITIYHSLAANAAH